MPLDMVTNPKLLLKVLDDNDDDDDDDDDLIEG